MRLIEADNVKNLISEEIEKHFNRWDNTITVAEMETIAKEAIDNAPTVTIKEWKEEMPDYIQRSMLDSLRPQGEWVEENSETGALGIKYTWYKCNQCDWSNSLAIPKNFCPNCGAKMKI